MMIKARFRYKTAQSQRGIAVVEFAIGMVVLLVLLLVTAELGRFIYSYNALAKSVRVGSRYLSTVALDTDYQINFTTDIENVTKALVISGEPTGTEPPVLSGYSASDVTLTEVLASGPTNQYVRVSASYTFTPIFASVPKLGVGGSDSFNFGFQMQSSSTMRAQR